MKTKPKHLDLFSGLGGFALAAGWAGFETIGFSEIEPYACKILKQHWPDVPNHGDVRTVPSVRCDLITGGFPCQPFSVAGKRRGADDDRFLWPAMLDAIARCQPAWVLGENVPGLIGMELEHCLADLEGIGFRVQPLVIPACAVGAPHRRDRVWIIAHAHEAGRGEQWRAEPIQSEQSPAKCAGEALANASRELPHGSGRTRRRRCQSSNCGKDVPDTQGEQTRGIQQPRVSAYAGADCDGPREAAWWSTEPGMGRVADGIPHRTHRLKALGNAIVPQVAFQILQAIRAQLGAVNASLPT